MLRALFSRRERDPFLHSALAQPAGLRLGVVAVILACLWLAVAWAVALP